MSLRTGNAGTVGTVLLVCVASAAGAAAGVYVRFPHARAAILYPPYAVVAAALLLAPPRRWWMYLLAGSVGTFCAHRIGGEPLGFSLMADAANYLRVLIAAWGVRRFGHARGELDTLKDMTVLVLFGAVLAPAAGAFVGAAVVALHFPGQYWIAWPRWLLSNVMVGLTLLPLILLARARLLARGVRRLVPTHLAEASALLLALLAVGALVLFGPATSGGGLSAALYAPLPLLLWAAVRFGPGATSASLLLVAMLAIAGRLAGRGPFVTNAPDLDLLHVQLFLFVASVPMLLLSALLKERQHATAALYASQQQYESVVEDQTDLICRFQPDGTLTFVNGACCQRARRPRSALQGSSFWALLPVEHREARQRLLAELTPARPTGIWEERLTGAEGEARWEQWLVRALFDGASNLAGYQALGRDVTEHKHAEEQRALLHAQETTAQMLREADRRKDEFLAMLAHELRNPLAPIAVAVEILRQLPSTDEDMRSARDIIERQTAQLARLVDDLLDVARITSGTIQLRAEVVDLARVVASAVEISRPLIDARAIQLVTQLPPTAPLVRGDGVRLAQLFSNLLNNSAKYSDIGGRVDLAVTEDGEHVVVSVKDRGIGIPPDMLERVFEPFTQVDRSRDGGLGGLGLGLALAKRLAALHRGAISARSGGPGTGSELVVSLPVLRSAGIGEARRPPVSGSR
jgi:PAS domain S-box-containing protein